MKQNDKRTVGRRDFLRVLGVSAGAAAAAPLATAAKADNENNDENRYPS